ncbi:class I SAM-dependent methyltransferase [Alteribacter keqinensis]|uniref:Class I SAM-dependent methyltransferase n=1 Tax=Alteribacter keqinensis TaxID=2483800 RepID=A0A3M7TY11_9BACI|nr:class I SAM-dependent methyltransferase [Alteribacter keqinensis]RNA70181.1 class I SAM-dependent methyltransferase [Alteribacter keqinensis]
MLNKQGFDLWAKAYDQDVIVSEEKDEYPFAGYQKNINGIYSEVMKIDKADVLDIGFGTGVLTTSLYESGHRITGIDFSSEMMAIARRKMPEAKLIEWDFAEGLPQSVVEEKFDAVVSTYTLHHLSDKGKVRMIEELLPLLKESGKIFIGDVAFETRELLSACREENLHHWDSDEVYFVADELKDALRGRCKVTFHRHSHCGGVFIIEG